MKQVVVVVDTQADFMNSDGALAVAGADALAAPMAEWLSSLAPENTAAVLFTFDTHDADTYPGLPEAQQFPIHCVRATPGWRNVLDPQAVDPAIPTYRLEKGVFAMWEEPDLRVEPICGGASADRDAFFRTLRAQGVDDAAVIGVAADYCVRWAIEGLVDRGFRVTVPQALTRGIARPIEQVLAEDFAGRAVTLR
ncbi:cysteine hydrolase family protein [Sphingomonas desiccabilis]|uniref:nicotinamidase n=1 Tax=Sphingomonas desiccabilis TaxID=429134 RepID=A0A4Q2IV14_9SPHN|nr:cysteine hydrolase family protein [Sphingomonas desiccabilis]MBB3909842.1 nicotinamidase/pyrazinamidase [Sphingomonas desiccabilis]RXZ34519.1 cysteine hydrolase family protein [Sphingomonas desiccabilis]